MKKLFILIAFVFILITPGIVHAQEELAPQSWWEDFLYAVDDNNSDTDTSNNIFNSQLGRLSLPREVTYRTDPVTFIMQMIQLLLTFLGLGTVILIAYAGYLYMMSRGNDEDVSKAKALLRNAVIGLLLILSAYSLTVFIVWQLRFATGS